MQTQTTLEAEVGKLKSEHDQARTQASTLQTQLKVQVYIAIYFVVLGYRFTPTP